MKNHISIFIISIAFISCNKSSFYQNQGGIFGTFYNIIYEAEKDYHNEIVSLLDSFGSSLSTYDSTSLISKINRNESFETDTFFRVVYRRADELAQLTDGAFDITVAPIVNLWGFGFSKADEVTDEKIDSLLQFVGYEKVSLNNEIVVKEIPEVQLDVNAIAKGYSSDVVADFLKSKGVNNLLVEIGGEIVTNGQNSKGKVWALGIDKPIDDKLVQNRELQMVVAFSGKAMATSGNYRNYYIKDGKKYAHTINPKTGYPVEHNLLSATIIADDCMTADALATACMVEGLNESITLIESIDGVEALFIYDDNSEMFTYQTTGFGEYVR